MSEVVMNRPEELTFELIMQDFYTEFVQPDEPALTFQDFLSQTQPETYGIFVTEPEDLLELTDADTQSVVTEAEAITATAALEPVVSPEKKRQFTRVRKTVGMVAMSIFTIAAGSTAGSVAGALLQRDSAPASATSFDNQKASTIDIMPTTLPTPLLETTTTTIEIAPTTTVPPLYRPAVGEQSAVLTFPASCSEEVSVREVPEEYILTENTSVVDLLEIDPTPQLGCEDGTAHAAQQRQNGQPKMRTREDSARFSIGDRSNLPTLPDGSRPTNYGQLQPIAERSQGSAMFGEAGVVYVDGHRSTESAPFALLDKNVPGDIIMASRGDGELFAYTVREQLTLSKADYHEGMAVAVERAQQETGSKSVLVVSACTPYGSETDRLIVIATL